MREIATETFDRKRAEGKLSLVHDIDHVAAVARYGSIAARYLSNRAGIEPLAAERNALVAEIAGWSHDIVREAKETAPHGPEGAKEIRRLVKEDAVLSEICGNYPEVESTMSFVASVVSNHEKSFTDMTQTYHDSPLLLPIAQGVVVGDKVFEASGPRVLERRAFFVGKERMLKDLKGLFKYPEDSPIAVLGETLVRLYKKSPANGYPREIWPITDRLHAMQYEFLASLLLHAGVDEKEAADYFLKKGFPAFTGEVAGKVKEEGHMSGDYFLFTEFPVIYQTIGNMADISSGESSEGQYQDLKESGKDFVLYFAEADTPAAAIEKYLGEKAGLFWFENWMDGVLEYRNGQFTGVFEDLLRDPGKYLDPTE